MPDTRRSLRVLLLAIAAAAPAVAAAQDPAPPAAPAQRAMPPLAPFAAQRVALVPLQFFRADTAGWGKAEVFATLRLAFDSTLAATLQERGMGRRWAYPADVVRSAKRNPTYASDPYALGAVRWRSAEPKPGDQMPMVVADNLRPLSALGDTRLAMIPVELRGEGAFAVLRLVIADTRMRSVVWAADLRVPAEGNVLETLSRGIADLLLEP